MARVLLTGFCAVPGPDRVGVQLRQVIRAVRAPHQLEVLIARDGEQAYVERMGGVRTLRVPLPDASEGARAQGAAYQRALRRQLDGADYDIVHCRDGWAAPVVREGQARGGYAIIYDLARAPLGEETWGVGEIAGALDVDLGDELARDEQLAIAAADLVMVPSSAAAAYATGVGARHVSVVPSGVDVDRFDWDDVPAAAAPPLVLAVGPVAAGRGLEELVRAVVAVGRPLRLRLVGPIATGYADGLRALAAGSAVALEFTGPQPHARMPAHITAAAVCVAPSGGDLTAHPASSYPTVLLEYLACRRPVIAPRRDPVARLVEHGQHGLLVPPGDVAALARALAGLLDDAQLGRRLAAAGYERVRTTATASATRRAVRGAYAELCARFAGRFTVREALAGHRPDPALVAQLAGFDDDDEHTEFDAIPAHGVSSGALAGGLADAFDESGSLSAPAAVISGELGAGGTGSRAALSPPRRSNLAPAPPSGDDSGERGVLPRRGRADTNITGA